MSRIFANSYIETGFCIAESRYKMRCGATKLLARVVYFVLLSYITLSLNIFKRPEICFKNILPAQLGCAGTQAVPAD